METRSVNTYPTTGRLKVTFGVVAVAGASHSLRVRILNGRGQSQCNREVSLVGKKEKRDAD